MSFTKQHADSLIKSFDSISSESQAIKVAMQMKEVLLSTDTLDGDKSNINHLAQHLLRCLPSSAYQSLFKSVMQLVEIHSAENINAQDADGKTFLYWAFHYGDVSIIELLIYKYGANINAAQDSNGNTLLHLHMASEKSDLATLKRLHKYHANINARNKLGETPLHLVIDSGNFETAKFLVEKKADVHAKNNNKSTPLHYITAKTPIESLRLLITHGAKVNAANITKVMPIHNAAKAGRVDILRVLIQDYSANIKATNDGGFSVLHFSALSPSDATMRFLIEGHYLRADVLDKNGEEALFVLPHTKGAFKKFTYLLSKIKEINKTFYINRQAYELRTLLHPAAAFGQLELVEYLIETEHAQYDIANAEGDTPLHLASQFGHFQVVQKLVKIPDAKINVRNKKNITPLHFAAFGSDIEVIHCLLEHKADINAQDIDGAFPWHYAARAGKVDNLQYLVEKAEKNADFNINALCKLKQTALHLAALSKSLESVQFLLNKKINFNLLNEYGQNALHVAAEIAHYPTVEHLVNVCKMDIHTRDQNGNVPLHWATVGGDLKTVKFLIQKAKSQGRFSIEMSGFRKQRLLHFAAHHGHKHLVELFLNMGADLTVVDEEGYPPLDYAVATNSLDVVKYLTEPPHCAPLRYTLKKLGTKDLPLHALANNHLPIVKYFVQEHKLTPSTIKLQDERNPLHQAAENGCLPLAEYLVKECKISVNSGDVFGVTPLHLAAGKNHVDLMKFLLDEGANINAQDFHKKDDAQKTPDEEWGPDETPLFKAARENHIDATRFLLKAGADIDIENEIADVVMISIQSSNTHREIESLLEDFDTNKKRATTIYSIFLSTFLLSSTPLYGVLQKEVLSYFRDKQTGTFQVSEEIRNKQIIVLVEEVLRSLVENVDRFKSATVKPVCIESAVTDIISQLSSDYSKAECYQYWDELKLEFRAARNKKLSKSHLRVALMKIERPSKLPSGPLMSLAAVNAILKSHSNTVVSNVKSEIKERESKHSLRTEAGTEEQELAQALAMSLTPSLPTTTSSSSSSSSSVEMQVCKIETKAESKQEIPSSSSTTSISTEKQEDIEMLPKLEPAHIFLQQHQTKTSYGASWWWKLEELSVDKTKRKAEDQMTSTKLVKQERNTVGMFAKSKSLVNEEFTGDVVTMELG